MLNQNTYVIYKMDILNYMMNKIVLNAQVVKWIMFLTKFDLELTNQKYTKG